MTYYSANRTGRVEHVYMQFLVRSDQSPPVERKYLPMFSKSKFCDIAKWAAHNSNNYKEKSHPKCKKCLKNRLSTV
jgi:hypothetical protein